MPKLPPPPEPDVLAAGEPALVAVAPHTVLWRLHPSVGPHTQPWNQLRRFGPVARCRFDPQEPPPGPDKPEGVCYTALDLPTALAETFQLTRVVDRRDAGRVLLAWRPTRTLTLLDLSGEWPLRIGASHVINTGRRDVCRAWARALRKAWPNVDGLWHTSSMSAAPCVTLWNPAADSFPDRPAFAQRLDSPGLADWLAAACAHIGYLLL